MKFLVSAGQKKFEKCLRPVKAQNRQAFIQNKRMVATTPNRVVTDPLFKRVRFDVLIAEDAPKISCTSVAWYCWIDSRTNHHLR